VLPVTQARLELLPLANVEREPLTAVYTSRGPRFETLLIIAHQGQLSAAHGDALIIDIDKVDDHR
jgi:hypothetical protein